jgi:hypothetical protein
MTSSDFGGPAPGDRGTSAREAERLLLLKVTSCRTVRKAPQFCGAVIRRGPPARELQNQKIWFRRVHNPPKMGLAKFAPPSNSASKIC